MCNTHQTDDAASDGLRELQVALQRFRDARGWAIYHTPKNLAISICIEAAELVENYQWQNCVCDAMFCEHDPNGITGIDPDNVRHEIADVMIYLLMLADREGVDIIRAVREKIEINAAKYKIQGEI